MEDTKMAKTQSKVLFGGMVAAMLAILLALISAMAVNPEPAYAWTGTAQVTVNTQKGIAAPSVTLRHLQGTATLKSLYNGKTITKKYYPVHSIYVDGKYKGKFTGAKTKVSLPRGGTHTIRFVDDTWSTAQKASKAGYRVTYMGAYPYYWDVIGMYRCSYR